MTLMLGAFVWLLGLCVGSFLNVVVYRLPRGLSINRPRRSFCPACETPIAAHDNIPVLSWLLLGGRCRKCRASISAQYPLVEAATGAAFVLVYYLIAVADARTGTAFEWPRDAAVLVAWLLLAATMIACSAMDLVAYMIDVRVTDFCLVAALALHALWPAPQAVREGAATPASAAAAATVVASAVMLFLTVWRKAPDEPAADEAPRTEERELAGTTSPHDAAAAHSPAVNPACARSHAVAARIGIAGFVVLAALLLVPLGAPGLRWIANWSVAFGVGAFFATIVLAGAVKRDADDEIHAAIEQEGPLARRTALRELAWLAPIIAAGAAVFVAVAQMPACRDAWRATVELQFGSFVPVAGMSYAMLGIAAGATAGWVLRILFTLVFGREAFGAGDIYILAAAGAACGWDIVLLGLLCSVGLALVGWLISLALKSSVMIPFGPWLAIGFVVAAWISRPFQALAAVYAENIRAVWETQPGAVGLAGILLLAGSAAAVVIARLLRVWLESRFRSDTTE